MACNRPEHKHKIAFSLMYGSLRARFVIDSGVLTMKTIPNDTITYAQAHTSPWQYCYRRPDIPDTYVGNGYEHPIYIVDSEYTWSEFISYFETLFSATFDNKIDGNTLNKNNLSFKFVVKFPLYEQKLSFLRKDKGIDDREYTYNDDSTTLKFYPLDFPYSNDLTTSLDLRSFYKTAWTNMYRYYDHSRTIKLSDNKYVDPSFYAGINRNSYVNNYGTTNQSIPALEKDLYSRYASDNGSVSSPYICKSQFEEINGSYSVFTDVPSLNGFSDKKEIQLKSEYQNNIIRESNGGLFNSDNTDLTYLKISVSVGQQFTMYNNAVAEYDKKDGTKGTYSKFRFIYNINDRIRNLVVYDDEGEPSGSKSRVSIDKILKTNPLFNGEITDPLQTEPQVYTEFKIPLIGNYSFDFTIYPAVYLLMYHVDSFGNMTKYGRFDNPSCVDINHGDPNQVIATNDTRDTGHRYIRVIPFYTPYEETDFKAPQDTAATGSSSRGANALLFDHIETKEWKVKNSKWQLVDKLYPVENIFYEENDFHGCFEIAYFTCRPYTVTLSYDDNQVSVSAKDSAGVVEPNLRKEYVLETDNYLTFDIDIAKDAEFDAIFEDGKNNLKTVCDYFVSGYKAGFTVYGAAYLASLLGAEELTYDAGGNISNTSLFKKIDNDNGTVSFESVSNNRLLGASSIPSNDVLSYGSTLKEFILEATDDADVYKIKCEINTASGSVISKYITHKIFTFTNEGDVVEGYVMTTISSEATKFNLKLVAADEYYLIDTDRNKLLSNKYMMNLFSLSLSPSQYCLPSDAPSDKNTIYGIGVSNSTYYLKSKEFRRIESRLGDETTIIVHDGSESFVAKDDGTYVALNEVVKRVDYYNDNADFEYYPETGVIKVLRTAGLFVSEISTWELYIKDSKTTIYFYALGTEGNPSVQELIGSGKIVAQPLDGETYQLVNEQDVGGIKTKLFDIPKEIPLGSFTYSDFNGNKHFAVQKTKLYRYETVVTETLVTPSKFYSNCYSKFFTAYCVPDVRYDEASQRKYKLSNIFDEQGAIPDPYTGTYGNNMLAIDSTDAYIYIDFKRVLEKYPKAYILGFTLAMRTSSEFEGTQIDVYKSKNYTLYEDNLLKHFDPIDYSKGKAIPTDITSSNVGKGLASYKKHSIAMYDDAIKVADIHDLGRPVSIADTEYIILHLYNLEPDATGVALASIEFDVSFSSFKEDDNITYKYKGR